MNPKSEQRSPVAVWLANASPLVVAAVAMSAGFITYFSMYAYRKPFTAATYTGLTLFGSDIALKTAFVIAQIFGYTASKFLSVRLGSELRLAQCATAVIACISIAQLGLLLFAILPNTLTPLALFLNGLPLGMVWGFVVRYLEGRRSSEILLAALSCSYIVASGAVKDIGRYLLNIHNLPEFWMPFAVGLLFAPIIALSTWFLAQLPPPDAADIAARNARREMDSTDRLAFIRAFLPGLTALFIAYFFITACRDYRDIYAVEILAEFGASGGSFALTQIELPVAFGVMATLAALNLVRDNHTGLLVTFAVMCFGATLLVAAALLTTQHLVTGPTFLLLTGLGSFLIYVPFGSVLFDRIIAATRVTATAVFAINLADAIGYTGSVGVQLAKDLTSADMSHLQFFIAFTWLVAALGIVTLIAASLYFTRRAANAPANTAANAAANTAVNAQKPLAEV